MPTALGLHPLVAAEMRCWVGPAEFYRCRTLSPIGNAFRRGCRAWAKFFQTTAGTTSLAPHPRFGHVQNCALMKREDLWAGGLRLGSSAVGNGDDDDS